MTARATQVLVSSGGRVRRSSAGLILLALGALAVPAAGSDETLARVDRLIASHAWQLANRVIESLPPDHGSAASEEFERRRLLVYRHLADIDAMARRIERLSADTSPEFRRWALEQMAEAALAIRDFPRARAALEQLLAATEAAEARHWRERLVRTYLSEDRATDALAAFAPLAAGDDDGLRALHAEILLRAGREREAFERVAGLKTPEARLWRVIAAMRVGLYAPVDVVRELALVVRELRDRPELQRLAWLVRAQAARQVGQLAPRVNSLEQAFRLDPGAVSRLAPATADDLWSAYLALARHTAQSDGLALGAAGLERADAYARRDPYAARALYAWHALEAKQPELRAAAHARLAAALSARGLQGVARLLYADSKRFVSDDIPINVQYALMQEALSRRDLVTAAKYARALDSPPPHEPVAHWKLRRARVLLYGGEHEAAAALLQELAVEQQFDEEFASRFLQVVFDLQAVGEHAGALELLASVYARVDNARMRRELLYWQAESAEALERFPDAAELYLRSARFGDADGTDRWGHSARYRAAEALAKADLKKDAETLYRDLLNETSSPDRRLLIEQNIERLWLASPSPTTR